MAKESRRESEIPVRLDKVGLLLSRSFICPEIRKRKKKVFSMINTEEELNNKQTKEKTKVS